MNRPVLLNKVLFLLVFSPIPFAPFCFTAQSRSLLPATDKSRAAIVDHCEAPQAEDVIRFEFYPGFTPNTDDSTAPFFIAIDQNGCTRALRYQLRSHAKPVASYQGALPEAEVRQLLARVGAAFRLPKRRKDYDGNAVYEGDGFYLALKSASRALREMSGNIETRPEEVRALVKDMLPLWKHLNEVTPSYAYLSSNPIEKSRLGLLRDEYKVEPTPIESLPSDLKLLLIPVVIGRRNFYPLTREQYARLKAGKLAVTYKGKGHELTLLPSVETQQLQK